MTMSVLWAYDRTGPDRTGPGRAGAGWHVLIASVVDADGLAGFADGRQGAFGNIEMPAME